MTSHILKIYSTIDLTDQKYLQLRSKNMSIREYSEELLKHSFTSDLSVDLLHFFINYNRGIMLPEKADVYEPIKDNFKEKDVIDWLSQAGGEVYLKGNRKNKYLAHIKNRRHSKIWEDNIPKLSFNDPMILFSLTLWISKNDDNINDEFISKLHSICGGFCFSYLGANFDGEFLIGLSDEEIDIELKKNGIVDYTIYFKN